MEGEVRVDVSTALHDALVTFRTAALVAAPVLGISLVVGLVVGIFQSTTQISEPTLSFVPKAALVIVALVAFGPWMLSLLIQYTHLLWQSLPAVGG
jgi:flagellar biosynthetic protein FliQ